MFWKRLSHIEIKERINNALSQNLNYRETAVLGLPASYLDKEEFYEDAPFLEDSPFLKALVDNPNHIGVHTLTQSEAAFAGTQALEKELIAICAEQIFKGEKNGQDGYVASGGTEANLEAMWVYRNWFEREMSITANEIGLLYTADSHYCMPKGADLFRFQEIVATVDDETRAIDLSVLKDQIAEAKANGVKAIIAVMNMATTMFGSVDNVNAVAALLEAEGLPFKIHVDGAFGGFIYPFSCESHAMTFQNPHITSFTLDAHKMLQAPYGTGIFLIRKGYLPYVCTEEAQYVHGKDYTLIGSRSGANAIAVWMILQTHGSEGWKLKIEKLVERTSRLCHKLEEAGIRFYRHPKMNIITIRGTDIPQKLAEKYVLVPDTHEGKANWWKIVVMDHVTQGMLDKFYSDLMAMKGLEEVE